MSVWSSGTDRIIRTDAGGGRVAFCASAVDAVVETAAAAAHVHLRSGHVIAVLDYASIVSAIWGKQS